MLFFVWNQFQVSPAAFSLLALGTGGIILLGKPWTPVLGTLYCLLFLLANWYFLDGLEEAESVSSLNLHLLLSPILLITFLTGIGATYRNYSKKAHFR
jgi:hypothetical protein